MAATLIHMPSGPAVAVAVGMGLLANLIAEWFLRIDIPRLYGGSFVRARPSRLFRWLAISAGCVAFTLCSHQPDQPTGVLFIRFIPFTLLSVTAATDLETRFLPPDWFTAGSVIAGVVVAGTQSGIEGAIQATLAQGLCFALMTLAVVMGGNTAAGDIKLMAQLGATAGSANAVFAGLLAAGGVAAVIAVLSVIWHRRMPRLVPLGPIVWAGMLVACYIGWT